MRNQTASIVIGPLLLVGAWTAAAGQPALALGWGAPIRSAAGAVSAADRDTYLGQARSDMQAWRQRLRDYSESANVEGQRDNSAAADVLQAAWTRADAASRKLQTVGAADWDSARSAYEKASRDLADAWDKLRSEAT
jgi:hypothetical protein